MIEKDTKTGLEIAVTGMACRFPGAKNLHEFWNNLKNGVEGISFFTEQELTEAGVAANVVQNPGYVNARGILAGIEYFDSGFFGYIPIEAETMDPQVRIFHECAWEALEDAGYAPGTYKGRIGLYAGASSHLGWEVMAYTSGKVDVLGVFTSWQLYDKDFMCTRVSYNLNLSGPSVNVQTACSTSLVAIHLACQGLLSGECHIALAGGITLSIPGQKGYQYQEGSIASPDGHCRPFAATAQGTVSGEGAGIVVLKLLDDALRDRDFIYAVIKSSAINNDGKGKVGFTAPGVKGQAGVIRSALKLARVEPETIGFVETHGTGTNLGDPAEIEALTQAFKTGKKGFCRIGSIKSNLGHTDNAAGAAGFIKAVLSLKYCLIPPSLHFEKPNPKIDFENSPFIVNRELYRWKRNDGSPLRAGVSSFGVGGTNAHVVLEEWHRGEPLCSPTQRQHYLMLLSAKSETALEKMTDNLVTHLKQNLDINLADAAYTLQVGREAFNHRRMFLCRENQDLEEAFDHAQSSRVKIPNRPVIFMFSGQGSQYENMGAGLYKTEPLFREELDRCFEILNFSSVTSVSSVANKTINQTENAQPLLFAFEYALAKLLIKWGIKPYAMIGHSIGEYVAACLSGVFSLEDALEIVALRGRLMQQMPSGGMLSVSLPEADLEPFLSEEIALAAVNSPGLCVVSGPHQAVKNLSNQLTEQGIENRILHTSHAFHSSMMDPILKEFEEKIGTLRLHKPRIPYISNLTGKWITVRDAADPAYWARHLRHTVQFSHGIKELLNINKSDAGVLFLEVGPGKALATFTRQHLSEEEKEKHLVLELVRHPRRDEPDERFLLEKIGRLWLYGAKIDWFAFYFHERRYRVPLPTYPFERQCYPIAGDPFNISPEILAGREISSLHKRKEISDWFYVPLWEESILPLRQPEPAEDSEPCRWLVFIDTCGLGSRVIERLEQDGQEVMIVTAGSGFGKKSDREFVIDPGQDNDYNRLFAELKELKKIPRHILHLWNVDDDDNNGMAGFDALHIKGLEDSGFYSLLYIARAIGSLGVTGDIRLGVVSTGMQDVLGVEELCPEKAMLLGAAGVISQEYTNLHCCSMDIVELGEEWGEKLPDSVLAEFVSGFSDPVIAFRGSRRWTRTVKPVPLDGPEQGEKKLPLREKGVYLITGGLGGIGLTLARYLAERVKARLVLTGRSASLSGDEGETLKEIEKLGAEVLVCSADVSNPGQMHGVIARTRERFGPINGVIHAAGVADGGIIQARTQEQTGAVLAPKVLGTRVLDYVLDDESLDFFVLCSSLASIFPPLGQVAYSAANAFLDAFAHYISAKGNTYCVSINWDSWQQVGMAARAVKDAADDATDADYGASIEVSHPLFDYCFKKSLKETVYVSHLRTDTHWIVDEHRILGKATLPGTACLEMARAAFEDHTGSETIEIRELYFLTPLRLEEKEEKEVHTSLEEIDTGNGGCFRFIIRSRWNPHGEKNTGKDEWVEHAQGELAPGGTEAVKKYDIEQLKETCSNEERIVSEEMSERRIGDKLNFVFGPRWESIKQVNIGTNRVLILLELPEAFIGDIGVYKLHPALLDAAVGYFGGTGANPDLEASLPFSYKKVKVKGPMSRRLYSYQEYEEKQKQEEVGNQKMVSYNITIMDEEGRVLTEIEDYRRLALMAETAERLSVVSPVSPLSPVSSDGQKQEEVAVGPIGHGLLPWEGIEVFRRVLGSRLPQVAVSTRDLVRLATSVQRLEKTGLLQELEPERPGGPLRPRPEISKAYAAPRSEIEKKIAETWQNFLGIRQIGIHDDFFELGGDSLKIMTIAAKIHKTLEVEIPLGEFFNNPTIAGIAAFIDNAKNVKYPDIRPVEKKQYYSLSSAQMRMYISYRLDKNKISDNMPVVMLVEGKLDTRRLNESIAALIDRHETLRTSFELVDNIPVQRVHQSMDFKADYTGARVGDEQEINGIVAAFIRPFDLGKAPLIRAGLVKVAEDKHFFMYDFHHIICDGMSLLIVINDFAGIYREGGLPGLKVQYKDFAAWQNELLRSGSIEEQEKYWLSRFEDGIPVLEMPTDFPRPPAQSFEGDHIRFAFDEELSAKIKSLEKESGATLYMVVLSISFIFLCKYSGQEDIVVGAAIAGRPHTDLENQVGMFVNSLAMRNYPKLEKTYREFLEEVKSNALKAYENQDYQFERLVERLGIERNPARHVLFDTMVVAQNTEFIFEAQTPETNEGPVFKPYIFEEKYTQFDIILHTFERSNIVTFKLLYCTKLFKKSTIEKFVDYFKEIAGIVVDNPGIKLRDIKVSHRLVSSRTTILQEDVGDFNF